jgi:deoxyribonuclease V
LWWPETAAELEALQRRLADEADEQPRWTPPAGRPLAMGGVFVATPRPEAAPLAHAAPHSADGSGPLAHAAAVVVAAGRVRASAVVAGRLEAPYAAGLLALREGRLLQAAVQVLAMAPDVLLVNATGRDHPRRAGLALHLGAACGLPSIGITDRPLLAGGPEPSGERGASAPVWLGDEVVGYRLRTRARARAVIVHAAWQTDAETARQVVLGLGGPGSRTPMPLRAARQMARAVRSGALAPHAASPWPWRASPS